MPTKISSAGLTPDRKGEDKKKSPKKAISAKDVSKNLSAMMKPQNVGLVPAQQAVKSKEVKVQHSLAPQKDIKAVKTISANEYSKAVSGQGQKVKKSQSIKRAFGITLGALGLASAVVVPLVVIDRNRDIIVQIQQKGGKQEIFKSAVKKGTKVKELVEVQLEGFAFRGWYVDEACTIPLDMEQEIKADMSIYAKYAEIIPITLDAGGNISTVNAYSDETISQTLERYQEYYSSNDLVGWYYDENRSQPVDGSSYLTGETSLYARYAKTYNITLISNGMSKTIPAYSDESVEKAIQTAKENGLISISENINWYYTGNFTESANLLSAPTQDFKLYARYIETYKLTIYTNDPESKVKVIGIDVYQDETIQTAIEKKGVNKTNFVGFYTDAEFKNAVDTSTKLSGNMEVYARYASTFSITIRGIGDEAKTIEAYNDTTIEKTLALNDIKVEENFVGWYLYDTENEKFTTSANIKDAPTTDLNLYARHTEIYTIAIYQQGATSILKAYADETIAQSFTTYGISNEVTDCKFLGWFSDENLSVSVDLATYPQSDMVIYGSYAVKCELTLNIDTGAGGIITHTISNIYSDEKYQNIFNANTDINVKGLNFYKYVDGVKTYIDLSSAIGESHTIYAVADDSIATTLTIIFVEHGKEVHQHKFDCFMNTEYNSVVSFLPTYKGFKPKDSAYVNLYKSMDFTEDNKISSDSTVNISTVVYARYAKTDIKLTVQVDNGKNGSEKIEISGIHSDETYESILERQAGLEGGIAGAVDLNFYKVDPNEYTGSNLDAERIVRTNFIDLNGGTIYARTATKYTLNVDKIVNGVTQSSSGIEVYDNHTFGDVEEIVNIDGKTFISFYTDSNLTKAVEDTNLTIGNISGTLYARYVDVYTVEISQPSGIPVSISNAYGDETFLQALKKNNIDGSLDDFELRGLYADASYSIPFDLNAKPTSDTAIYAKYAEKYNITVNNNGKTQSITALSDETIEQAFARAMVETKLPGFEFRNWHLDTVNGEVIDIKDLPKQDYDNKTIIAEYAQIFTLTVKFEGNSLSDKEITAYSDETIEQALNKNAIASTPSIDGYVFRGWDVNITDNPTNNIEVTATFAELHTVAITKLDEVITIQAPNDTSLSQTLTNNGMVGEKEDYIFEDWYTDAAFTTSASTVLAAKPEQDIQLFAKYKQQTTTFIVVEHGVEVNREVVTYYVNETKTVSDIRPAYSTTAEFMGVYGAIDFISNSLVNETSILLNAFADSILYLRYADECTIQYSFSDGEDSLGSGSGVISTYSDITYSQAFADLQLEDPDQQSTYAEKIKDKVNNADYANNFVIDGTSLYFDVEDKTTVTFIVIQDGRRVSSYNQECGSKTNETLQPNTNSSGDYQYIGCYKSTDFRTENLVDLNEYNFGWSGTFYVRYAKLHTVAITKLDEVVTVQAPSDANLVDTLTELNLSGEKEDYIFEGWFTDAALTTSASTVLAVKPEQDIQLFAKYKQQTTTFIIVEHGVEVDEEVVTYYVNADMTIRDILPEFSTLAEFRGVYSSRDFTENPLNDATELLLYSYNHTTLYLRYAKPVTITYTAYAGGMYRFEGTISTYSDVTFADAFGDRTDDYLNKLLVDYLSVDKNSLVLNDRELYIDLETYSEVTQRVYIDGEFYTTEMVLYPNIVWECPHTNVVPPPGYNVIEFYTMNEYQGEQIWTNETNNSRSFDGETIYVRIAKKQAVKIYSYLDCYNDDGSDKFTTEDIYSDVETTYGDLKIKLDLYGIYLNEECTQEVNYSDVVSSNVPIYVIKNSSVTLEGMYISGNAVDFVNGETFKQCFDRNNINYAHDASYQKVIISEYDPPTDSTIAYTLEDMAICSNYITISIASSTKVIIEGEEQTIWYDSSYTKYSQFLNDEDYAWFADANRQYPLYLDSAPNHNATLYAYTLLNVTVNGTSYNKWYKIDTVKENLDRLGIDYSHLAGQYVEVTNSDGDIVYSDNPEQVVDNIKLENDDSLTITIKDIQFVVNYYLNGVADSATFTETDGQLSLYDLMAKVSALNTDNNCGLYKDAEYNSIYTASNLSRVYNLSSGEELPSIYTISSTTRLQYGTSSETYPISYKVNGNEATASIDFSGVANPGAGTALYVAATFNGYPVTAVNISIHMQGVAGETYSITLPGSVKSVTGGEMTTHCDSFVVLGRASSDYVNISVDGEASWREDERYDWQLTSVQDCRVYVAANKWELTGYIVPDENADEWYKYDYSMLVTVNSFEITFS